MKSFSKLAIFQFFQFTAKYYHESTATPNLKGGGSSQMPRFRVFFFDLTSVYIRGGLVSSISAFGEVYTCGGFVLEQKEKGGGR